MRQKIWASNFPKPKQLGSGGRLGHAHIWQIESHFGHEWHDDELLVLCQPRHIRFRHSIDI